MTPSSEASAALQQRARQFLVHSFLYYRLGESVVSDTFYDRITEELRALRKKNPKAEIPHGGLIDAHVGAEASGFGIKEYPPEIISAAFKLLYAVNNPPLEFAEFVEQRGYVAEFGAESGAEA